MSFGRFGESSAAALPREVDYLLDNWQRASSKKCAKKNILIPILKSDNEHEAKN